MNKQETDYQQLAKKMVARLKQIKYRHPEITDAIDSLQAELQNEMRQLADDLAEINDKNKDFLTLLIINEIHKSVDEIFS